MAKVTLGGNRLGSGKKQKVDLRTFNRATFDLSYVWKSSMAAGTLVPFMSKVMNPGDTFDIDLFAEVLTHPTIGPLFGSYKVQLDVFLCPVRLYIAALHNNKLGVGLHMNTVYLPQMELPATIPNLADENLDADNSQINPSAILPYLGVRGVGINHTDFLSDPRSFNAVPLLAYWDIYKNYYANKQEEIGAVIHTPQVAVVNTVDTIDIVGKGTVSATAPGSPISLDQGDTIIISWNTTAPILSQILLYTTDGNWITAEQLTSNWVNNGVDSWTGQIPTGVGIPTTGLMYWQMITQTTPVPNKAPIVETFPLENIDEMREKILQAPTNAPYVINDAALTPYSWILGQTGGFNHMLSTQEGLAIKTYQSDLFNNWLQTEWIDGTGGINEITSVSTVGDSFKIDALIMAKKVYDMLNQIGVTGGSYNDYIQAVYDEDVFMGVESPVYLGGLIRELVFQEVISNSESPSGQPLGTLAGRGIMSDKRKGGSVVAKAREHSYLIGIVSLTPRLDYSQGNTWDVHLDSIDAFHKPHLDQIGFQELDTEQMAWWQTQRNSSGVWETISAGKQTAWINYQTEVNRTYGNFAIQGNEMFMTLNRRYERDFSTLQIRDLTTYIDPSKFNNIFAQQSLDAQNFWAQIGVKITARRKMSAKVMPHL